MSKNTPDEISVPAIQPQHTRHDLNSSDNISTEHEDRGAATGTTDPQLLGGHVSPFEAIRLESEAGVEYWSARDLAKVLGYDKWEKFLNAIQRAESACENSGQDVADHFQETSKVVSLGNGAKREVEDVHMSRYGCYFLIEREDLPGFIVARRSREDTDSARRGDSRGITTSGNRGAGRKAMFRWRPLQQFYNWVGRTHVSDIPVDERATVRAQLTGIKEALEKQLVELGVLEQLDKDS